MSNKSVFSIINFESAPRRTAVARPDFSRAKPTPTPRRQPTAGRRPTLRPRSITLAGWAYERTLLLLVGASFAAFFGAYLLGTALELLGALLVPVLIVALLGFVGSKVAAARRAARGEWSGYAAVVDPERRLAGGR